MFVVARFPASGVCWGVGVVGDDVCTVDERGERRVRRGGKRARERGIGDQSTTPHHTRD